MRVLELSYTKYQGVASANALSGVVAGIISYVTEETYAAQWFSKERIVNIMHKCNNNYNNKSTIMMRTIAQNIVNIFNSIIEKEYSDYDYVVCGWNMVHEFCYTYNLNPKSIDVEIINILSCYRNNVDFIGEVSETPEDIKDGVEDKLEELFESYYNHVFDFVVCVDDDDEEEDEIDGIDGTSFDGYRTNMTEDDYVEMINKLVDHIFNGTVEYLKSTRQEIDANNCKIAKNLIK